jgi:uncharacterized membrane protein
MRLLTIGSFGRFVRVDRTDVSDVTSSDASSPSGPTLARSVPNSAANPALGWLPWSTLLLAIAGVAVAAYLTYEHFTAGSTLACPDTGAVSCAKVTTSQYSELLGIPVAVLGVGFFVARTALCLPFSWVVSRSSAI